MKRERETRSISLEQISSFTKIHERHLKAIEEDRYELLPPALYVKGFLIGYARYLDLDPQEIVVQYEKYKKSLIPPEPADLEPKAPHKKKGRQWFLLSLAFAVILSAAYIVFYPGAPPVEKKDQAIPPPSASPSSATHPEPKAEMNPVRENELSEPERAKVDVAKEEMPVLTVLEAGIGTGVEKEGVQQVLTGKCSGFRSNNQRGYFFTKIKTGKAGKIAHIWIWEGKEYHRMEIDVIPPAWSVYSYFTFRPQHTGNWKAEARDGNHVLASLNFNVAQSSEDRPL